MRNVNGSRYIENHFFYVVRTRSLVPISLKISRAMDGGRQDKSYSLGEGAQRARATRHRTLFTPSSSLKYPHLSHCSSYHTASHLHSIHKHAEVKSPSHTSAFTIEATDTETTTRPISTHLTKPRQCSSPHSSRSSYSRLLASPLRCRSWTSACAAVEGRRVR